MATRKDLEKRVKELERKVRELESRPMVIQPVIITSAPQPASVPPVYPPQPIFEPYRPTITCSDEPFRPTPNIC